jgi:hypothetical protein
MHKGYVHFATPIGVFGLYHTRLINRQWRMTAKTRRGGCYQVIGAMMYPLQSNFEKNTSTLFTMVDSNDIRGMVVVDAQATHLGWMDEENNIGVLQKNASQLPIFDVADIDGQWSGEGFWCNANMDFLIDDLQSDMSVNNLVFSVQDNYNTDINGSFLAWWSRYGAWRGLYNPNVLGESGSFTSLLTVDKNFVATFSIDNSNGPGICPQDYRYRFLSRK